LKEDLAVLTIHARTRKEMSKVPAHWIDVKRVVEIRNEMKVDTLIFGNGDVNNLKEAMARVEETGCDGVMIGRGIFGNPWLWSEHEPTTKEKLLVLVEHTKLFEELMTGVKSFALMKKHYKAYVNGFDGAGAGDLVSVLACRRGKTAAVRAVGARHGCRAFPESAEAVQGQGLRFRGPRRAGQRRT
jgi:tRNA-dihydrouridine synthase